MVLTEKIKVLNLLPLTPDLVNYICEFDPSWFSFELDIYSYAKFFNGKVYLYSLSYIENISVDQFNIEFARQL
jgi:hypothetical protein